MISKIILNYSLSLQIAFSACATDEYLSQGTNCLKCNYHLPNCLECSSGAYAELENGSFEDPEVDLSTPMDNNYYILLLNSIPSWTQEPGQEVELNRELTLTAQAGSQYLQTSGHANYYVYQDLVTEANYKYQLELYYSPHPGTTSNQSKVTITWGDLT